MPDDLIQKFDDTVDRMHRQQDFGLSCYAFLSGIANNSDRGAKYSSSYAGHALDLCIKNVQTGLVLYCTRHWDTTNDVHSIPTAKANAERALDEIVERHRKSFAANGFERDAQEFYGYFEELSSDVEDLGASLIQSQIRVLRTEHYAHLTTNSRDRQKALSEHLTLNMDGLTIDKLLSFARQTIELSDRFIYLKQGLSPEFDKRVAYLSAYYDKFWDNLPIFSEIEGPL
jgi:hypothetical protein